MYSHALLLIAALLLAAAPIPAQPAQMIDNIVSQHVRVRVAPEREWIGRESILELERCWQYMYRATGEKLPKRILVVIDWDAAESANDPAAGIITIGMSDPAAVRDRRSFLLHGAAREMAELALHEVSKGGTERPDTRFLRDGMAEILAHEYDQSIRTLNGAWAISHLVDRVQPLSLARAASAPPAPSGVHALESAAPAITFLLTAREQHGRERLLKLFEAMRKEDLEKSMRSAFRVSAAALEAAWLQKIRSYSLADATATAEEEAPALRMILATPDPVPAGGPLQVRLSIEDRADDLLPGGVFLHEQEPGRVFAARTVRQGAARDFVVEIPAKKDSGPGRHEFRVTVIDEAGNIRNWTGAYTVR